LLFGTVTVVVVWEALRAEGWMADPGPPIGPRGPGAARRQNQLVFESDLAGIGHRDIWRMNTDGSGAVRLTQTGGHSPYWWVPEKN